ncbi:hypothetical protein BLNAU_15843 [Blattamonas nauphoetae]|uniref:Uncharacterized protein n=1 Tax=Blattamonas nauphoetae TaxID=2049346 RepID=A0ABQ9XGE8_9EUKA|nr:hypothetical protein BLNAU_15843 [Blattamonas nauphoetae]
MGNNSSADQHRPLQSFIRDAHGDSTPLFLRINPNQLRTVKRMSEPFLSLVDFVKEGNSLDKKATEQACALLKRITPHMDRTRGAHQILFDLVPTSDGSCSGFTESIIPLLTSSNEELINSTLSLLEMILNYTTLDNQFEFLGTEFFCLLPQSFYEQEMHLSRPPELFLMNTMYWIKFYSSQSSTRSICQQRNISTAVFQRTFIDKFFHPIEPFLEFICKQRRRIKSSLGTHHFFTHFGTILESPLLLEEMTPFVLSSSFALAYTDILHFVELCISTGELLQFVTRGIRAWKKEGSATQKCGQLILTQLHQEGLADEIELHSRCRGFDEDAHRSVFVGTKLIEMFGGNAPFWAERVD